MSDPNVITFFEESVKRWPKRPAILWGRDRITYGELAREIDHRVAYFAQKLGVRPGDRVGILLRNGPEYVYFLYAALKCGATVVPINTFLKGPEIQHIADDCRLSFLVTDAEFDEVTKLLSNVRRIRPQDFGENAPSNAGPVSSRTPDADSLALIIYTSGTTGKSKGAMLTHGNIAANVQSCIQALEETSEDRLTLLLPMFHSFMLTVCVFTPLSMGAGIVLIKSVQPFKLAMREIIRNRATILVGIPQLFQAMAQAKLPFWLHWVLNIRMAISGAAPLPRETLTTFERKFRFPLLEGYGLSEASPVVSFNPLRGVRKPGTVGLPIPGVQVAILDDNDQPVPTGQVGEICVRGPNVMRGYYNQPEETAAALRNGWLHTGDMGTMDADGYITIVDRRKEMYLVRGMNVYPREIEEVLYTYPNVREAAVVARPDEKRGETAVAFVSPVEGTTLEPADLMRHCRERLADYKLPREIRIVPALPRTATGKVAKLELKKLI